MKELSIITGGNSGLGYAIAVKLVAQKKNVALIGRDADKLDKCCASLKAKGTGAEVLAFAGDISDESFAKKVFMSLAADQWGISNLFNCAGVGRFGKPEENTREKIDIAFSASLIGIIVMSTQAVAAMQATGGNIINVMSSAALKGNPNETIYCAAKWGARGYTEALKAYLKGSKTKVIGVYPGGMKTPFWNEACGMMPDTSKFMDPDEVADEILYAVHPRTSMYVSDISVDRK